MCVPFFPQIRDGFCLPNRIIDVPFESMRLDLKQPRKFFPRDLRSKVAAGQLSPADALAEFFRRAGQVDLELSRWPARRSTVRHPCAPNGASDFCQR